MLAIAIVLCVAIFLTACTQKAEGSSADESSMKVEVSKDSYTSQVVTTTGEKNVPETSIVENASQTGQSESTLQVVVWPPLGYSRNYVADSAKSSKMNSINCRGALLNFAYNDPILNERLGDSFFAVRGAKVSAILYSLI
ncbi:MAG: hypothetical protein LBT21_04200 [Oscillospiraceae bacterium]|jgi:hypothetical protein|nr:hypothetical protein [Oscillospiraceae bacterium]